MKKIIFILIIIALLFLFLSMPKKETEKITVITTLFPYYDMAKKIGGEEAEVHLLLPPGTEPHSFEPKSGDFLEINDSEIFVYTGEFMEPWVKDFPLENVKIINASAKAELVEDDPHIWLDIENAKKIAKKIAESLIELSPENKELFLSNLSSYEERLSEMDNNFKSALDSCKKREIIYGGHYAFGYFSKRYNLEHTALQGFSPDAEPTAKSMVSIIEKIREDEINYIFYEELASLRVAEIIAEETNAELLPLNPAGNLSKEDFEKGVSFFDIMEENFKNLKIGLQCL